MKNRQNGVALLTALVFLIVLTILGLASMRSTTMQERMSGNLRDQSTALQAAEAGLRDARMDFTMGAHGNVRSITTASFPALGTATCNKGLCSPGTVPTQISETASSWTNSAQYAQYGEFTSAGPIVGLSQQPRYILELLPTTLNAKLALSSLSASAYYVRITSQGYGLNADTIVRLQEVVLVELDS